MEAALSEPRKQLTKQSANMFRQVWRSTLCVKFKGTVFGIGTFWRWQQVMWNIMFLQTITTSCEKNYIIMTQKKQSKQFFNERNRNKKKLNERINKRGQTKKVGWGKKIKVSNWITFFQPSSDFSKNAVHNEDQTDGHPTLGNRRSLRLNPFSVMSDFRWSSGGNAGGEDYVEMKRYLQ